MLDFISDHQLISATIDVKKNVRKITRKKIRNFKEVSPATLMEHIHPPLCCNGMVAVPLQIQVSVGWFSVHCSADTTIRLVHDQSVQKRHGSITPAIFHSELNSIINGVDMLYETVLVCRLDDHECVMYIFFHRLGGYGAVLRTCASNASIYKFATIGLTHSSCFNLICS